MEISLNKFISETGYCSRREADRLIEAGRVTLNNKIAVTGNRYKPGDEVVVDGSIVKPAAREKRIIMAFNKPVGITTTTDTNIRGNIISFINYPKRIFPIGRLDKDSEGLIFLTNDGDVVNKILRAGNQHEKEYAVRVDKALDSIFLRNMSEGVRIDEGKTLPCKMRQTGRHTFNITLVQGLNRQIRKMCEALGYKVTSLQRVRIMHVKLDKLAVGKWRYLSEAEMETLYEAVSRGKAGSSEQEAGSRGKAGSSEQKAVSSEQKTVSRGKAGSSEQKAGSSGKKVDTKKTITSSEFNGKKKSGSYKEFRRKGKK
ncbi:MAG TPA: pseudouridine synthase [Chitinophagaceae bacterium]|nr:pseudouridine synthase [Chitinophagaceae bacterium]